MSDIHETEESLGRLPPALGRDAGHDRDMARTAWSLISQVQLSVRPQDASQVANDIGMLRAWLAGFDPEIHDVR